MLLLVWVAKDSPRISGVCVCPHVYATVHLVSCVYVCSPKKPVYMEVVDVDVSLQEYVADLLS